MQYAAQAALGADGNGIGRWLGVMRWLGEWLLNRSLLALVLVAAVAWWGRARIPGFRVQESGHERRVSSFLWTWALVPPLFMAALGLLAGARLQTQWPTAFALWGVPAMLLAFGVRESRLRVARVARRVAVVFLGCQLLLAAIVWDRSVHGLHPLAPTHWCRFPARQLAHELSEQALPLLGGRVEIISGPAAPMQALALHLPGQPRVLIERDPAISPWVTPQDLASTAVLDLWLPGQGPDDLQRTSLGWGWRVLPPAGTPLAGGPAFDGDYP